MAKKILNGISRIIAFVGSLFGAKPVAKAKIKVIGSMESGQGSCFVVEDGDMTVVIDCGANSTNGSVAGKCSTESVAAQIVKAKPDFMVVTHFHADHAAFEAVINAYQKTTAQIPPIIATDETWELLQRRLFANPLSDFMARTMGFRSSDSRIKLIPNRHSVIGSAGALVLGPKNVLYTSDFWAMDLPSDLPKVDLLIVNCTTAHKSEPRDNKEPRIRQNIMALISETLKENSRANCYVAMFSTQLERAMWMEREVCRTTGSLPVIIGTSLRTNLDAVRPDQAERRSGRVVLATGVWAHGVRGFPNEGVSALVRLANNTDRSRSLKPGDLVVLSGSIPTWHHKLPAQIEAMCRKLKTIGVRLVVDVSAPESWEQFAERKEVHAGGHGNMPEIEDLINRAKPKQVMPFHASPEARAIVARYCESKGIKVIAAEQSSVFTF